MEKLKLLAYFAFDIESYNNINVIREKDEHYSRVEDKQNSKFPNSKTNIDRY